jgi:plasmid stabilization system protein ParE
MGKKEEKTARVFQLRLTDNASRNIDEIAGFIAFVKYQPINAANVVDSIFDLFERIEKNPFHFKECDLLPTKSKIYRQALCFDWKSIYKIQKSEVIILGIIHGGREPSKIKALRKKSS